MAAETADVIVVGAGLSGLTAAREIQRAGYSCIVLEAEDRVGGMLLSVDQPSNSANDKVAVDVGAGWLNDTTQSAVWGLLTPDELKAMSSFYATLGALVATIDPAKPHAHPQAASLDAITLADFCAQHTTTPLVSLLLNASVRYLVGAESSQVSALWFLAHCAAGTGLQNMMSARPGGGQHLRLRAGTQRIAERLAGELAPNTVRLSTPAASIDQSTTTPIRITTATNAVFLATHALILAIPSTLHPSLTFSPPLPPSKHFLATSAASNPGFFAKATLVFDRPWWRDAGAVNSAVGPLSGIFESVLGPVVYSRNTDVAAAGHYSITGSIVGEAGERWWAGTAGSREERREAVVRQLRRGFGAVMEGGEGGVPEPVAYVEGVWRGRRYGGGGGSVPLLGPGVLTKAAGEMEGGGVGEPFGRVFFVGAETAEVWRGYMEGAVRSGLRGAEEVLGVLRKGEVEAGGRQQVEVGKL
ncbi:flavin-containing amine oxidase [Diplodia corticola]|uniref:Amine oxidase n=1 Tax=Diplodia corticola TaxID=236234 RepID=A0A1J9S2F4_9PEZI|nr:flavin-containing amine oxidase [Diplodia corticola]OJD34188.1 flavin-containing amine oxidase [Diplodia corticola]